MNKDLQNFSTDLLRISYWIYDGRLDLAKKMLKRCKLMYNKIEKEIGCYKNIWEEIEKIENIEGGRNAASERASTASVILLHKS